MTNEAIDLRLQEIWNRAYAAETQEDLRALYADWAKTYDEDHEHVGFFGHRTAARMLARHLDSRAGPVLDAGAGTGAAGEALAELGFTHLVAADMSPQMLEHAASKGVYRDHRVLDLGKPLDDLRTDSFDACILVGVFSYGQAPAHALEELVRVVAPGGLVVLTMRTDFFEEDAMGVRSKLGQLEREGAWELVELGAPEQYLPNKDPEAMFRVWCFRALPTKRPRPAPQLLAEVRAAVRSKAPVKRIDHACIWDRMGSRLYEAYTECEGYYLTNCEEQILLSHGAEVVGRSSMMIELGCGSARKIRHVLDAALRRADQRGLVYLPIDLSQEAIEATTREVREHYGDRVKVTPRRGHFDQMLAEIPADAPKTLFFFGSSIGNFASIAATVEFLQGLGRRMLPADRLLVGIDLDKDPEIILDAYRAGPENLSFFLNMVRRINRLLGAELPLEAFTLAPAYALDPDADDELRPRVVDLRLGVSRAVSSHVEALDAELSIPEGGGLSVGKSRKFRREDVAVLARRAGLRLTRQWVDDRGWFSLNELRPDDAP